MVSLVFSVSVLGCPSVMGGCGALLSFVLIFCAEIPKSVTGKILREIVAVSLEESVVK